MEKGKKDEELAQCLSVSKGKTGYLLSGEMWLIFTLGVKVG